MRKIDFSDRRVWLGIGALVALALVLVSTSRSRPAPVEVPDLVLSDSTPDPRAVGMCARGRDTGRTEGVIVGLVRREDSDQLHFRVQSREHAGAEYVMAAVDVQVVKCEDPEEVAFRGS
jgi:hypothetical protein